MPQFFKDRHYFDKEWGHYFSISTSSFFGFISTCKSSLYYFLLAYLTNITKFAQFLQGAGRKVILEVISVPILKKNLVVRHLHASPFHGFPQSPCSSENNWTFPQSNLFYASVFELLTVDYAYSFMYLNSWIFLLKFYTYFSFWSCAAAKKNCWNIFLVLTGIKNYARKRKDFDTHLHWIILIPSEWMPM